MLLKFSKEIDQNLGKANIEVRKTAFRSPNTNAFVERFIQTIQLECLDHFVVLGQQHFDYLVSEWLEHYHTPHQALANEPLHQPKKRGRSKTKRANVEDEFLLLIKVRCKQRLGGLLKSYSRKAA